MTVVVVVVNAKDRQLVQLTFEPKIQTIMEHEPSIFIAGIHWTIINKTAA